MAKGSVWYLAAAVDGEVRSYRVSRVSSATLVDEPCVRLPGFDLAAWWERSSAEFKATVPRYFAIFRAHPEVLYKLCYAGRFSRVERVGEADEDGWTRVGMRFQFEEEAAGIALSFGPRLEVIDPPGLRDPVLDLARSMVAFYEHGPRARDGTPPPDPFRT